jgi:O-antigen ligase
MNLDNIITIACILTPLFLLSIKGYSNGIIIIISILSIYYLVLNNNKEEWRLNKFYFKENFFLIITLTSPFISVFISEALRWNWSSPEFDAPIRLLLVIPLLFVLIRIKTFKRQVVGILIYEYAIPFSILSAYIGAVFWPATNWGSRLTTYFPDPLTFGYVCSTMATLVIASINMFKSDHYLKVISKLAIGSIGYLLAIKSETRTGMIGVPLCFLIIICIRNYKLNNLPKIISVLFFTIFLYAIILTKINTGIQEKWVLAIQEILNYKWNEMNVDGSVQMRISFLRMAWYYFTLKPIVGWGDLGWMTMMNSSELLIYASQYTREFAKNGFHNEIATNMVHFGLGGLISSVAIFFSPLIYFKGKIHNANKDIKGLALLGFLYTLMMFISGMTTEVLSLKFTTSFYGFIIVITVGSIINIEKNIVMNADKVN